MIIALGKTLGLDVLAKGVETEGQLRELIEMGCDS
jgi:EAL domain-containing protein (putative c-di-GMP-specific phosphodiesterase class I)